MSHNPGNKHKRYKVHSRDESPLPEEVYAKRSCRTRSNVSYQFKEFDELINQAIEEDIKLPKPPRPPKPPGMKMHECMHRMSAICFGNENQILLYQEYGCFQRIMIYFTILTIWPTLNQININFSRYDLLYDFYRNNQFFRDLLYRQSSGYISPQLCFVVATYLPFTV